MIKIPEDKVIITVAQTGALVTKAMNAGLPEQPAEIAESANACYQEGAAICHIHGRDKEGKTTGSKEVFQIRLGEVPISALSNGSSASTPSRRWPL